MTRVAVSPHVIRWARERADLTLEDLLDRFSKLSEWETGKTKPTLKQLEKFAKAVYVPFGFLFLEEPPIEKLPIPDFRTLDNREIKRPSPNLLDMIYTCQERQSWYKEFIQVTRKSLCNFVGSARISDNPEEVAEKIRNTLGFDMESRLKCKTWEEALRLFIRNADDIGILIMVSSVVFSNNSRKLNISEFRGFALSDSLAPLVFVNGADSKSGQMFTLAHELAHLWLNSTGLSNAGAAPVNNFKKDEVWCNAVAAELLVPISLLYNNLRDRNEEDVEHAVARLVKYFKVSALVILRRLLDANWLKQSEFDKAWAIEKARLKEIAERNGSGGNFYRTTISRVSHRFTQAIVTSTLEGQTLYRDAFRMLGVSRTTTFNNLGREVGVML